MESKICLYNTRVLQLWMLQFYILTSIHMSWQKSSSNSKVSCKCYHFLISKVTHITILTSIWCLISTISSLFVLPRPLLPSTLHMLKTLTFNNVSHEFVVSWCWISLSFFQVPWENFYFHLLHQHLQIWLLLNLACLSPPNLYWLTLWINFFQNTFHVSILKCFSVFPK